jgi:hypothetical protein
MNRPLAFAAPILIAVILVVPGCNEDPVPTCDPCPPKIYVETTAPESVLVNLQTAYRRREIQPYAALLAPEFTFTFTPADVQSLGLSDQTWTRGEDSTGTAALFRTTQVSSIRVHLGFAPAVPDTESGHPPGTMRIRVTQTDLEVDQTDGLTWIITQPQDFFFRGGNAAAGEDPSQWFLLEWRELELIALSSGPGIGPAQLQVITWGVMKARYRN